MEKSARCSKGVVLAHTLHLDTVRLSGCVIGRNHICEMTGGEDA